MSVDLKIDWASHHAARYAVAQWHYSGSMPAGKTVKIGVWEDGVFIGAVIFSRGATPMIGSPYGLKQTEICELTRVALTTHRTPVSRILAIALRFLKRNSPNLRMIVSFADAAQNHHGGIYQAGNWVYVGGAMQHAYRVRGGWFTRKRCTQRTASAASQSRGCARACRSERRTDRVWFQAPVSHAAGRRHAPESRLPAQTVPEAGDARRG